MNYKELLKKYINYVGEMEGVTFLGERYANKGYYPSNFTKEEWEELNKLDKEAYNEYP